jgi:hypothetical protein
VESLGFVGKDIGQLAGVFGFLFACLLVEIVLDGFPSGQFGNSAVATFFTDLSGSPIPEFSSQGDHSVNVGSLVGERHGPRLVGLGHHEASGEDREVASFLAFDVGKVSYVGFKSEAKATFIDAAPNFVSAIVIFSPHAFVPLGLVDVSHDVEDASMIIVADTFNLWGD